MRNKDLDTLPATNRWWASQDANRGNLRWEPTYSESQRVKASQMRGCLDLVYGNRAIHVNYRKRFISIKVDRAVVRHRTNLRLLEADWNAQGIERRNTAQGVIYRIPRA